MLYTTGGNALLWGTRTLGPISFYSIVISFTHNPLTPMAELSELLSSCFSLQALFSLVIIKFNFQIQLPSLHKQIAQWA